jgi:hypothetical protein
MAQGSRKFDSVACGCELNFQWHTGYGQLFRWHTGKTLGMKRWTRHGDANGDTHATGYSINKSKIEKKYYWLVV